jgi:antitoxin CptB
LLCNNSPNSDFQKDKILQLSKLKWQCRRGTQELDKLLLNYLEKDYPNAALIEQQQFQQLLVLEDSQLLELFFSQTDQNHSEFNALVEKIRHPAHF